MKKILFLLLFPIFLNAQTIKLSPKAEITVITCGSGEELYSTFGHSAFRVYDINNKLDRVYNYGTFNFNTENFYLKFTQGKLLYELRAYSFANFLRTYHYENRWVEGQVLDLTEKEKQTVYEFLENNAKPENRAYKYDFFYDNCSTRIYDVLENTLNDKIIFDNNFDKSNLTHRNLIQKYLGDLPWSDFGIDLALGSVIDRKATAKEYMFLPDYVFKALENVKINRNGSEEPIIKRTEKILLDFKEHSPKTFFTPLIVFSLLALLVLWLTYRDLKNRSRNKILDYTIFIVTGVTGVVVLLLWFATDHSTTKDNYNFLWAFAPNLIFAFLVTKNQKMTYYYIIALLILLDILVTLWIFKVQIFSIALIPILVILYIRYIYLWFYFKIKKMK